jgi:gamma-glutamyl-gamma-aminobutyrate hydrolase PuuD
VKFKLTNADPDIGGKVRLSIDTTHELALEILAAAVEIEKSKPDPIVEAMNKAFDRAVLFAERTNIPPAFIRPI